MNSAGVLREYSTLQEVALGPGTDNDIAPTEQHVYFYL